MNRVRFLFVLITATVLAPGTSLARQADHPSQQQAHSQSGEKSESDYQRDVEVRKENGPIRPREAGQISKRSTSLARATNKPRSTIGHARLAVSHPRHLNKTPATNGPRIDTPVTVTEPQETSSRIAVPVPNQMVGQRSASSAVSVNGQQFKNSRDPGAHLAISGGPLTAARGTAAINGTNMKHKP